MNNPRRDSREHAAARGSTRQGRCSNDEDPQKSPSVQHWRTRVQGGLITKVVLAAAFVFASVNDRAAAAATWQVTSSGDGPPAACTVATCTTLREAITNAASGDTITFASGLPTILLGSSLRISNDLTITNSYSTSVVIDAQGQTTALVVSTGTSTITNLTITRGRSNVFGVVCQSNGICGGGVFVDTGATLTLDMCTITGNIAQESYGGGIYNRGTLTLTGTTVSNNGATYGYGGGIFNMGRLTINGGSSIFSNSAFQGYGGGIFNGAILGGAATLTMSMTTVMSNTAEKGYGGGLFNGGILNAMGDAHAIVDTTTFSDNSTSSGYGGGIFNGGVLNQSVGADLLIHSSTFTGNTSDNGYGGAILNGGVASNMLSALARISNSTFSGNSVSKGYGGAVFNGGIYQGSAPPTGFPAVRIGNSTLSGNSAPGGFGGAIFSGPGPTPPRFASATTDLGSSIVTGNTAMTGPDFAGDITSLGNNLFGDVTGLLPGDFMHGAMGDQTGTFLSSSQLAPLAANGGPTATMALGAAPNPALGMGFCAWPPATAGGVLPAVTVDQRGFSPRGSPCDVGAYELAATAPAAPPDGGTSGGSSSGGGSGCATEPGPVTVGGAILALFALVDTVRRRRQRR
jgi:hypothetical protein